MDIPSAATGTAAAPWLVLGVLLGVGLVLLAGLVTALAVRRRPGPAPLDPGGDDLPGFLESPPGSARPATTTGWAALATAPAPPTAGRRRGTLAPLIAMGLALLLLLAVAAGIAATSGDAGAPPPPRASAAPATATGAAARLTFGGVVLEPRAVGVTATYPVVDLSASGDRTVAHVEFPTFNCLTADAPADPVAAGCYPAGTEYAELGSPDLAVRRDGDGILVSGRFPTELRPNGSAPTATSRVYALRITVTPTGGAAADGWRPARATLDLGPGRATTVDRPGVNLLRAGS